MNNSVFTSKFIVLDGPDGCGKTTQTKLLSEYIESLGCKVENFRDPGTTVIGEAIRDILLGHDYHGMGDNVELLLYMAARAQLWKEKIAPALAAGSCVVMDRWLSSSCAYQGYAGGFGIEAVVDVANISLERSFPDLTIILDLNFDKSSSRLGESLDRMETKGGDYHRKVREGYLKFAELYKSKKDTAGIIDVIDASQDIETVQRMVLEKVLESFSKEKQL